jgi:hypothetical protein
MTERNRSRGFSSALAPLMASSPGPVRAVRPGEAPGISGSTFTPAFNQFLMDEIKCIILSP